VSGTIVWALKRAKIQCAFWYFSSYHWGADGPVRALERAWTRTGQNKDISQKESKIMRAPAVAGQEKGSGKVEMIRDVGICVH